MPNKYLDSVQLGRLITKIKTHVSTTVASYLPLTGGSITGDINLTGDLNITNGMLLGNGSNNTSDLFFVGNSRSGYDGSTGIYGADRYANGAAMFLYGKNNATSNGGFSINAFDGTTRVSLLGSANGTLLWGGHNIALAKDFLPLAGGTMTGNIHFNKVDPVLLGSNTTGQLGLYAGVNNFDGASLQMFGRSDSTYAGAFYLRASTKSSANDSSGVFADLIGKPNGSLMWYGKEVERVTSSGTNYIRFESGLQIVWGWTTATTAGTSVTFPVPFVNASYGVAAQTTGSSLTAGWSNKTTTGITIQSSHATAQAGLEYICIGKWK